MKFELDKKYELFLQETAEKLERITDEPVTIEGILSALVIRFEEGIKEQGDFISSKSVTPGQIGDLVGEIVGTRPPPKKKPGEGSVVGPREPITRIENPL